MGLVTCKGHQTVNVAATKGNGTERPGARRGDPI